MIEEDDSTKIGACKGNILRSPPIQSIVNSKLIQTCLSCASFFSGYGFCLWNSIDAASLCIDGLRAGGYQASFAVCRSTPHSYFEGNSCLLTESLCVCDLIWLQNSIPIAARNFSWDAIEPCGSVKREYLSVEFASRLGREKSSRVVRRHAHLFRRSCRLFTLLCFSLNFHDTSLD